MKTKLLAVATATALFLAPCFHGMEIAAHADDGEGYPGVVISVEEGFDNLNIFSMTEHSSTADWIFTMMYDRLLYLDNNGNFQSDLATEWEFAEPDFDFGYSDGEEVTLEFYPTDVPTGELAWEDDNAWEPFEEPDELYFLTGPRPLVLQFTLRDDVYFTNEEQLTADKMKDLIEYAHRRPKNTLIYKLWSPVYYCDVIEEFTFKLYLAFPQEYGFIDFLYELASPMASIVNAGEWDEFGLPLGTGAFSLANQVFVSEEPDYVTLQRNTNWWGNSGSYARWEHVGNATNSGADQVTFIYESDAVQRSFHVNNGVADIGIVDREYASYVQNQSSKIDYISTNPIAIMFNLNPVIEPKLIASEVVRKMVDYCFSIEEPKYLFDGTIATNSNDFWEYGVRYFTDLFRGSIRQSLEEEGIVFGGTIRILTVSNQTLEILANKAQQKLKSVQGDFDFEITVVDEEDFEEVWQSGEYDVKLFEVDLYDINSVYNTVYGCGDYQIDCNLVCSRYSADLVTYRYVNWTIQAQGQNNFVFSAKGWNTKILVQSENVFGFSLPHGQNTTGNLRRLDFRWVRLGNE